MRCEVLLQSSLLPLLSGEMINSPWGVLLAAGRQIGIQGEARHRRDSSKSYREQPTSWEIPCNGSCSCWFAISWREFDDIYAGALHIVPGRPGNDKLATLISCLTQFIDSDCIRRCRDCRVRTLQSGPTFHIALLEPILPTLASQGKCAYISLFPPS